MLGAQAVARAFPEYSTAIVKVYPPAIHLKDYINVVQPEVLVVSRSPAAQRTFKVRTLIVVIIIINSLILLNFNIIFKIYCLMLFSVILSFRFIY